MYVYLIVTYYEPMYFNVFSTEAAAVEFAQREGFADAVLRVKVDASDDDEDAALTVWERKPRP